MQQSEDVAYCPQAPDTLVSLRGISLEVRQKRRKEILSGLPDAMDFVQARVFDGETLENAVIEAAPRCPRSLSEELEMATLLHHAGMSMRTALQRVAERLGMAEFDLFVTACSNASRVPLVTALGRVSQALRARNRTRDAMQNSEQAAARAAAVIGLIPVAMLALLTVAVHDHVAQLLATRSGSLAFSCSMALALIGSALMSIMGRAEPGMSASEAEAHVASLGRRTAIPMAVAVLPAMLILAMGPTWFGGN